MAYVASPGMTRPGSYSSTGQTAHDADANGYLEFWLKLKNFITGTPELDYNGAGGGITQVGTTDSGIFRITLDGGPTEQTGTWQVRRLNGTTLRVTDPALATTDVTVTWGTFIWFNTTDGEQTTNGISLSFLINDTGADQLVDGEGWDLEFVANGLPAADAWFTERTGNRRRTTSSVVFGDYMLRGRRTGGETDPGLVPLDNQFYVEWVALENESIERYQTRTQWVTDISSVVYNPIGVGGGGTFPPTLGSLVRCPMWRETNVSGARLVPYYIVATARWCQFVVLIDGIWFGGYFGLMDSFATTEQYPLPFLNGGCSIGSNTVYTDQDREVSWAHMSNDLTSGESNLYWRTPEGTLESVETPFVLSGGGPGTNTIITSDNTRHQIWPWGCPGVHTTEAGVQSSFLTSQQPESVGIRASAAQVLRGALDGSKVFLPATLCESAQGNGAPANRRLQVQGQIPFTYWTNGFGASAGDVITTGGRDFALIQNTYRTAEQGFWALELV